MSNIDKDYDPSLENSIEPVQSKVESQKVESQKVESQKDESQKDENSPDYENDRDIPSLTERQHSQTKKAIFWGVIFVLFVVIFVGIAAFAKNYSEYRKQQKVEQAEAAAKNKEMTDVGSNNIEQEKQEFVSYPSPDYAASEVIAEDSLATNQQVSGTDAYTTQQPTYEQPNYNAPAPSYNAPAQASGNPVVTPQSRKMGESMMYEGGSSANNMNKNPDMGFPSESGNMQPVSLQASGNNGFANQYQAATFASTSASQRTNLSLLLKQGTIIPCVLLTRIDSTYSGQTACQVTKDIYSANGKTLLVERGSKVIGEQSVKLEQGQARVFVLWSKLDTPKGVTLTLDSGAVDNLGASGIGAKVNTHFWKRFGNAILLSVIEDGLQTISNKQTSSQSGGISYNSTSDATKNMATTALENSINIPPTATVNQGTLLNIFVARDVDFNGVYELARK